MAKNRYYMFGRNCDTDEVMCIPFSSKSNSSSRVHSLEEIDLFTTSFATESDLTLSCYEKGLIDGYHFDFFIVVRSGDSLKYLEPIYGMDSHAKILRDVAAKKDLDGKLADSLLDAFVKKMCFDPTFSSFINSGFSSVYPKFLGYFKKTDSLKEMFNYKYNDGSWARQSYPLVRNAVESIVRYPTFITGDKKENITIWRQKMEDRGKQSDKIRVLTNPDYIDGQISMFDMEEKVDQYDYVMSHLDIIEKDTFLLDDHGYSINLEKISKEEDSLFIEELQRMLPQSLMALFSSYARSKYYLDLNLGYDYFQIRDEFKSSSLALTQILKNNSSLLNRAYSFLLLYNKCMSVGDLIGWEKKKDPS